LDETHQRRERGRSNVCSKPGIVKNHLLRRIDAGFGMIARDAVHFVNVADPLFWPWSGKSSDTSLAVFQRYDADIASLKDEVRTSVTKFVAPYRLGLRGKA